MVDPILFPTAADLRSWFERHHSSSKELWIVFFKKGVPGTGVSYDEAVEEALCFGWIDGLVKRLDERRYMHRFSPRTPRSPWTPLNVRRARALIKAGRMHPSGQAALDRWRAKGGGPSS